MICGPQLCKVHRTVSLEGALVFPFCCCLYFLDLTWKLLGNSEGGVRFCMFVVSNSSGIIEIGSGGRFLVDLGSRKHFLLITHASEWNY